ncbi:Odorant receptor [Nesidiocoris tenuis]|uniref:Odorant receptor n=1 Tax=Nesidiocoris tenuis TaxID=355587 RepID=A0ABN7A9C4_9HEMI|nr:Odorant receptor [Nesidiocoris tenuis]
MTDGRENKLLPLGFKGWKKNIEFWKNFMNTVGLLFIAYDRKRFFPEGLHIVLIVALVSLHIPLWIKTALVTFKTDLSIAILALNFALYGILALMMSASFHQNREVIYDIFRDMKVYAFRYETHNETPWRSYNLILEIAYKYILTSFPVGAIIVIYLVPLIIPSEVTSGGWTSTDGVNRRMAVITWYPFACDEGMAYLLTYLSQMYIGTYYTFVFASGEINQIQIAKFLLYELETLAESIRKLDERVRIHFYKETGLEEQREPESDLYKHPVFQKSARFCLIENIKHQAKIVEYFKLYCKAYSPISFFAYIVGTAVIAICLITLNIKKNGSQGTFFDGQTVMLLYLLVEELLFMFYISWIGELIITISQEVNQEIQFISLEKYDSTFRKYVLFFLVGTTREMTTKSGGYFDCKMDTFRAVINGSYSFFNFANASMRQ